MSGLAADEMPTLVEALARSFAASIRPAEATAEPVALLWTDAEGEWKPLLPSLRNAMPQLYSLGHFAPADRRGPVIWLKCIVERALPEVSPAPGVAPILYLPHVSRQALRAGSDCLKALQPLIELQYRGAVWHQRNGRDWTVEAFLTAEQGLGLDIAHDDRTWQAMRRALPLLATRSLGALHGKRLTADDFDRLAIGDPAGDLLAWLSDRQGFEAGCDAGRWEAFRDISIRGFGFDPEMDEAPAAAEAMINDGARWDEVWQRFRAAPQRYRRLALLLRQVRPRDLLGYADRSRWPGFNAEAEDKLRRELEALCSLPPRRARECVIALEARHRERRGWVWAELGESPLALALEPLARLAKKPGSEAVEALSGLASGAEAALVRRVAHTLCPPEHKKG